jgi:NAD(P)-dependent dehydrogenase (short-subunit alcohol dehydrogenase family)
MNTQLDKRQTFVLSMTKTFANKVVLVTGATSGIGRTTAVAFAEAGAKVVISGRRKTEGEETVSMIEKAGGQGLFVQSDVSDETQVKSLVETVTKKFGRLDIAFNNAGLAPESFPITQATVEQYNLVFDINVKGVFLAMKHEILAMLETGGSSIVNMSSVAGQIGLPTAGLYVATKHAVNGLTKVAALEVAKQGIRVNSVSPAVIETDMTTRSLGPLSEESEKRKHYARLHPVGRFGRTEEIASAVLFLSSPGASFITGHDLVIDGGYTVQ